MDIATLKSIAKHLLLGGTIMSMILRNYYGVAAGSCALVSAMRCMRANH